MWFLLVLTGIDCLLCVKINHQDGGQEQSYHEAMAEGDIHSYQTLITDVPQGPRLLSLHLGTGGRPAFQGATTYSEGT